MGKRDYFPMFFRYRDSFEGLSDEQVGRIVRAAIDYAADGKTPRLAPIENMAFAFIRGDIDRAVRAYEERCEKNRQNVQRRWEAESAEEPEEDTNEYERIRTIQTNTNDTKQASNQASKQSSNQESGNARARTRGETGRANGGEDDNGFVAPDSDAVRHYCEEAGITVDADRFCEHYGSLGWRKGSSPIRDWKALVRKWAREDREKAAAEAGQAAGMSSFDEDDFLVTALKRTYGEA